MGSFESRQLPFPDFRGEVGCGGCGHANDDHWTSPSLHVTRLLWEQHEIQAGAQILVGSMAGSAVLKTPKNCSVWCAAVAEEHRLTTCQEGQSK